MSFTSSASFFIEGKEYRTIWRVVNETYVRVEICTPPFDFEESALTDWSSVGYTNDNLQTRLSNIESNINHYNDKISNCDIILNVWTVWIGRPDNNLTNNYKWVMNFGDNEYLITQVHEDEPLIEEQPYLSIKGTNSRRDTAQENMDIWLVERDNKEKLQTVLNNWLIEHPPTWGKEETARLQRLRLRLLILQHIALYRAQRRLGTEGLQEHVKLLF
jgi:hypothetical protein